MKNEMRVASCVLGVAVFAMASLQTGCNSSHKKVQLEESVQV